MRCLSSLVPQYCGSAENKTCLCTSEDFTSAVQTCAYEACQSVPELLQLQRHSAVSCGVKKERDRLEAVQHTDYAVPFLTSIFIVGRISARIRLGVGFGSDDWMILAASLTYYSGVGTSIGLLGNGFGQHTYWLTNSQITNGMRWFYGVTIFYLLCITFTKISLLCFFLRIFPEKRLRQAVQLTMLFVLTSNCSLLLALVFQCVSNKLFLPSQRRN